MTHESLDHNGCALHVITSTIFGNEPVTLGTSAGCSRLPFVVHEILEARLGLSIFEFPNCWNFWRSSATRSSCSDRASRERVPHDWVPRSHHGPRTVHTTRPCNGDNRIEQSYFDHPNYSIEKWNCTVRPDTVGINCSPFSAVETARCSIDATLASTAYCRQASTSLWRI